jgi:flavin-dependent dehydrogenase
VKARPDSVDIAVLGGGPAGSAVAIKAAQLGHKVCVIERGCGPRHCQFGQSLAPSILPLFDVLGVRDAIEAARFPCSSGVLVLWGENFPRYREFESGKGFHIERRVFDAILRQAAMRFGAVVLCPADVVGVERTPELATPWTVRFAIGRERREIHAKIIVDAAGKRPAIPFARPRRSPPLIAVLGNWRVSRTTAMHSVVEAGADRWYWAGPQRDGTFTVAVFFGPRSHLVAKSGSLTAAYRSLIGESRTLRHVAGELLAPIVACDPTSRSVSNPLETGLVRVGEAALSLDPLSSQGIQTALTAGLQAAVVVNTWLRRPRGAAAADPFYRERHAEMIEHSENNSHQIYAEAADRIGTAFWRDRSSSRNAPDPSHVLRRTTPVPDPFARLALANNVRLTRMAVARDDLAEFAPAIVWPGPQRPVAFVGSMPVGELATLLATGARAHELVRSWSSMVGEALALKALAWMWQTGVIDVDKPA